MIKRFLKYFAMSLQINFLYWLSMLVLVEYFHVWYLLSAVVSTAILSTMGFLISSFWIWKGHKQIETGIIKEILVAWPDLSAIVILAYKSRFIRYYFTGAVGSLLSLAILYTCTDLLKLWYVDGMLVGYVANLLSTFVAREKWIWKEQTIGYSPNPIPQPDFGEVEVTDKLLQIIWAVCLPFYLCTTAILILTRRAK
jgi:putative flippase GtrA